MDHRHKSLHNAFGVVVLGVLFSLPFSVFCEGAFAAPLPATAPSFEAPAQSLGTYRVASVRMVSSSGNADLCAHQTGEAPERNCSRYFWLVRNGKELAILEAKPGDDNSEYFESAILDGHSIHRQCDADIKKDSAFQGGLFSGHFCRAYLESSKTLDTFAFGPDVPELAKQPVSGAGLEAAFLIFLAGAQVESRYTVSLPRGEASPKKIRITETISGSTIVFGSTFKRIYSLEYVGN